ncbi:MAG: FAD-dependent oxidoreductase [Clostridia bacterium]|nr:FAD-dependent oxidoreductase [Clostridia bacterium]
MRHLELKKDITWIGAQDPELRVFDIIMETEYGTSYNAYLVKGTEKVALFETVKAKCYDSFKERLETLVDIKDIDYIIVDHTEPDHAGSVEMLLKINPNITIVGSTSALGFLREITNYPFECMKVNTGDKIDLGGKTLEFISAPFLHWPDSMYTYIPEDALLITCDSFGAHYAFDDILYSKIEDKSGYNDALKYYFDMIMGPFKQYVLQAIQKIKDLKIDMICPGHGPVLDENPLAIVETYKKWATESSIFNKKTVVIPYVSAYGYTKELAEQISEGLKSTGVDVIMHDMVYASKAVVLKEIRWADGIMFGTPTINGDALPPIWELVLEMSPIIHKNKLAAVFGSFGWSGEGVPNIEERLKMLRMKIFAPGYKIRFKPSIDQLEHAYLYGMNFGNTLLGKDPDTNFMNETHEKDVASKGDGKVKKWVCVVCGDVFEGEQPPDICPTCGASHEQFELYEEEEITYSSEEELSILIIGNGVGALSAAKEARLRNAKAKIEMITEENHITYNRPMLIDYVGGEYDQDHFIIEDAMWYEDQNIDVMYDTKVLSINKDKQVVETNKGNFYYNKLILAQGSCAFVPPITDINAKGVHVLKDIKDAHQIIALMKFVDKISIIGGGLLGLEAADVFNQMHKSVTVFEVGDRLVPRQLDEKSSDFVKKHIEKQGVKVINNARISHIVAGDSVEGIALENGDFHEADMILVSAGVRPNIQFVKDQLDCNRGIIVNEKMETSASNIYAVGDVAEYNQVVVGLYQTAIEQGKIAGANVVGDVKFYESNLTPAQFSNFNIEFFSIGEIYGEELLSVVVDHLDQGKYSCLYFKEDVLVGGILLGDMKNAVKIMNGMKRKALRSDFVREFFG